MLMLGFEEMGRRLLARQVGRRTSQHWDYPAQRWRGTAEPNTVYNYQ